MGCTACEKKIGNAISEFVSQNFYIRPQRRVRMVMKRARFHHEASGTMRVSGDFESETKPCVDVEGTPKLSTGPKSNS